MTTMRIGAPVAFDKHDPQTWIDALRAKGYRAAFCPVSLESDSSARDEYRAAATEADIVIAEVGAWSNPLSPDREEAENAFTKCVQSVRLADEVGALCCVNIAGNQGRGRWDGAATANYGTEAFDRVVSSVQRIIDEAAPERTFYCLETMPWMPPDSVESYAALLAAIDRKQCGVHFDPVNLLNSPTLHFENCTLIRNFVDTLGDSIISVHAKDQGIGAGLTLQLPEVIPGTGDLDYQCLLSSVAECSSDIPIMVEHLHSEDEYDQAVKYIREQGKRAGIEL